MRFSTAYQFEGVSLEDKATSYLEDDSKDFIITPDQNLKRSTSNDADEFFLQGCAVSEIDQPADLLLPVLAFTDEVAGKVKTAIDFVIEKLAKEEEEVVVPAVPTSEELNVARPENFISAFSDVRKNNATDDQVKAIIEEDKGNGNNDKIDTDGGDLLMTLWVNEVAWNV